MQNRGANFTLKSGEANTYEGGKRPYHTIIPAMLTVDGVAPYSKHSTRLNLSGVQEVLSICGASGEALASFTNMGGYIQPQAHVQLVCNMVDYGMDPQVRLHFAQR